jgi:hypothetical protein
MGFKRKYKNEYKKNQTRRTVSQTEDGSSTEQKSWTLLQCLLQEGAD